MKDTALKRELQQLSPAQLRELLSASGHGQLLRAEGEEAMSMAAVDEQLVTAARNEGNAFFRQGRMQGAVSAYSRCIEMDSSHTVCLSNRAAAYLKLKQFDLAVADCSKAIDVAPTIKPFMRRATAYIALQHYGKALSDLVAALGFEPRNKECRVKLEAIVDAATDGDGSDDTELRRAGVRAAVILSVREGWTMSAVRGNPGPAAANGHTLFNGVDGRIYLFGGRAVREQKPDVFVLDASDDSSWDIVSTRGSDPPSSRAWHSTSVIGNEGSEFYCIYGGVSSRGEDSRVHFLVPTSPGGFQWVLPRCLQEPKQVPAPRSGHAAVSVATANGFSVYMFGGRTKSGVSNNLLMLQCSSTSDSASSSNESATVTVTWDKILPSDHCNSVDWPSARDGHSMCILPCTEGRATRLVVFGGNGQLNGERMNDVWLFDVEKRLWTLLHCCGDIPPPRSYHTAHTIGEFLFVVGGRTAESEDDSVYMLDVGTSEWFKVPTPSAHSLTPRAWHSSVLTVAGTLFVLGGGTYHGPLKDAAMLDLSYFQTKATKFSGV